MRLVVVLFAVVMFQATPPIEPEKYPGQHSHAKPPADFFCSATAKDKAHKCACKRMLTPTPEDPVCEFQEAPESPQCTVWCHKDHCLCPVTCAMPDHHHAEMSPK